MRRIVSRYLWASVFALSVLLVCARRPDAVAGPGGGLFVDDSGAGSVNVVFLHSLAGDSSHWHAALQHLRAGAWPDVRAVALDFRGHGRSEYRSGAAFTIRDLADDLDAMIRERDLAPAILVGHSLGGLVALEYAGRHPERVRGLLLVDSAGDSRAFPKAQVAGILRAIETEADQASMAAYWNGLLGPSAPGVRARVLGGLGRLPRAILLSVTRDLFAYDPGPALRTYRGPMRVLYTSMNDGPGSLQRLRPDMPAVRVDGAGHWLQLDQPAQLNQELDQFLKEVGH